MERLQKFLAAAGIASRRKCEEYIQNGYVTVNGKIAEIGQSVDPSSDIVCFNGKTVTPLNEKPVVIMLNKPRGVISTCSDPEGRKTAIDFFSELPYRVYNVGRLDIDSEGLLLLTNDGDFAYKMTHPTFEIGKTYRVLAEGSVTAEEAKKLRDGIMLTDGMTYPAQVERLTAVGENTSLYITIHEGRNRQVRRMMEAISHRTLRLRRVAIGKLTLGNLRTGEWRYLTEAEIKSLVSNERTN